MIEINNDEYKIFQEYLLKISGIHIPYEKKYLFNTRLSEIMDKMKLKSFNELYNHLQKNNTRDLKKQIIEVMTTNETSFFRDCHPFDLLQSVILPKIVKAKIAEEHFIPFKIRIWSAACSTGQEPYSIAMVISEWLETNECVTANNFDILATDISGAVLSRAEKGVYYNEEIERGMKEKYIDKYIKRNRNGLWEISNKIKQMIEFKEFNLSRDFSSGMLLFDIIFCRNLIIYFSNKLKTNVMNQFYKVLNTDGILIIGAAENLYGINDSFEVIPNGQTTIYKVKK